MNQSRRRAACSVEAPQARCRDCSAPPPSRAAASRAGSLFRRPDRASQVRNRLSAGGRWIRTIGSAREEIEKSWYPVGVQLILYGFARPRDRWFADSPLEGDRLEPSLPLTRQHLLRAFGGCPSVIEKSSLRRAI